MQLTESGTINIGGQHAHYHIHLPPGIDPNEVPKILSQHEQSIMKGTTEVLEAQKHHLGTLPDNEQLQFMANAASTTATATIDVVMKNKVNVKDELKIEMFGPSREKKD